MTDVLDQTRDTVTGGLDAVAAAAGVPSWVIPATLAAVTVAAATGYRTARAARAARNGNATSSGPTGPTDRAEDRAQAERAERADRVLKRVETVGTVVAALLATAVSASGMWRFFADVLGVTGPARVLMFAFLEVALFVTGVRARRHIREVIALMRARHDGTYTGPIPSGRSVHQVLVWVIVVLTGVMSAADTPHWSGKLLRLAAPAVAAILWEIGAVAELQAARIRYGITPDPLAWRYSLRRLLVLARLADPTPGDGDTTDALARGDRGRRLTALVRARYRLEATSARAPRALATWRAWRVRRLTIAAVEHAGLGTDPGAVAHVQYGLALLYTVHTGTAPAAVTHLDPWRTGAVAVREYAPTVAALDVPGPASAPEVGSGSATDPGPVAPEPRPDAVLAPAAAGAGPVLGPVVRGAAVAARPSAPGALTATVHPVRFETDGEILASLAGTPPVELPSIRALMRAHGIGQNRATRIHRAATDRAKTIPTARNQNTDQNTDTSDEESRNPDENESDENQKNDEENTQTKIIQETTTEQDQLI